MNDMVTDEYIKATNPAVNFLMTMHPYAAILAQSEGDTECLIEMLEDIVKEAQQHIDNLKAMEE